MRLLVAASLLLLGLATVPAAQAADLDAVSADLGILECKTYAQERDGDGEYENWNICSTPTCGCACPVVGAGVVVEAVDQERGVWVATSGCQTAYATMADDADGGAPVSPFVWTWGLPELSTS